jgi:hypothetical protein
MRKLGIKDVIEDAIFYTMISVGITYLAFSCITGVKASLKNKSCSTVESDLPEGKGKYFVEEYTQSAEDSNVITRVVLQDTESGKEYYVLDSGNASTTHETVMKLVSGDNVVLEVAGSDNIVAE